MNSLTAGLAITVSVVMAPFLAGPSGSLTNRFAVRPLVLAVLLSSTFGLLSTAYAARLES